MLSGTTFILRWIGKGRVKGLSKAVELIKRICKREETKRMTELSLFQQICINVIYRLMFPGLLEGKLREGVCYHIYIIA